MDLQCRQLCATFSILFNVHMTVWSVFQLNWCHITAETLRRSFERSIKLWYKQVKMVKSALWFPCSTKFTLLNAKRYTAPFLSICDTCSGQEGVWNTPKLINTLYVWKIGLLWIGQIHTQETFFELLNIGKGWQLAWYAFTVGNVQA